MTTQVQRRLADRMITWIYPRRCPLCDALLAPEEKLVCRACAAHLPFIRGAVCLQCGRPLAQEREEYCDNCRTRPHRFSHGSAPFQYGGAVQESLMRFKYNGRAEYAAFYAQAIALFCRDDLELWRPQLLVPVPVHPFRYAKRGYDQAALIAEKLSELTGIPTSGDAIQRRKNTKPQKGLSPSERAGNLQKAFRVRNNVLLPERILIIDDIYTTGTTVDQLTAVLQSHGAGEIRFACVSIARGQG